MSDIDDCDYVESDDPKQPNKKETPMNDTLELKIVKLRAYCEPGTMDFELKLFHQPGSPEVSFSLSSHLPRFSENARTLFVGHSYTPDRELAWDSAKSVASLCKMFCNRALWDSTPDRETFWTYYSAEFLSVAEEKARDA